MTTQFPNSDAFNSINRDGILIEELGLPLSKAYFNFYYLFSVLLGAFMNCTPSFDSFPTDLADQMLGRAIFDRASPSFGRNRKNAQCFDGAQVSLCLHTSSHDLFQVKINFFRTYSRKNLDQRLTKVTLMQVPIAIVTSLDLHLHKVPEAITSCVND
jgi:hypothetical protein